MPLVYQQNINESTRLAVWHITEPENFFGQKVPLTGKISHPHKRLQHLAGRYLLPVLFEDFPLSLIRIAETRKPFLQGDPFHFSISHSGEYAAAIVSSRNRVGVDIETVSEKVERVVHKFLPEAEQEMIFALAEKTGGISNRRNLLTLAWSVKETMYKWYCDEAVDFIDHLEIASIEATDNQFSIDCIFKKNAFVELTVNGLFFNGNFLTWLVT